MLDVVQRDRGRRLHRRDADRQRVVDGVDDGEPPRRAAPAGRSPTTWPPVSRESCGRPGTPWPTSDGSPSTRVGRDGRQVDAVGERPATREGAQELAGRRLAASELARNEREERDPDHVLRAA